ncbi:hypothetical protein FDP41_004081 [Naegleria fowleri]|uniref:Geranylgeranyl transferase type-2 subunit alpha n=1 Tax=Naegleria fowleri TaxID=5763 RepID=A0A6A5BP66_NAEFO|nr:uncharacterized protein FDP41_004081 [Naegleria fowleri]KAF0976786.1 hypothetical protein FDP41_004081 [Naegleria fowleri]
MHGIPRNHTIDEKKKQILKEKIQVFSALRSDLLKNKHDKIFSYDALSKIEKTLYISPEFYTLWNYRKEIITHLTEENEEIKNSNEKKKELYEGELQLTQTILSKHHIKSYATWHHRCWIMQKLDSGYWENDLKLTAQLLSYDNRNFHCWNYRRFILQLLDRKPSAELEYLYGMLDDVQNYSAWHNRSALLVEYSEKESIPFTEVVNQEYDLCTNAFYTEPSNQSAWIYHRWLLASPEGKTLKSKDLETCNELLDMMTGLKNPKDEKWCLVTIVLNMLDEESLGDAEKETVITHLNKLVQLDPTHKGYYHDIRSDFLLKHYTNRDNFEKLVVHSMQISRMHILNTLPEFFAQLKHIDLSNNNITLIPTLKLEQLEELILDNNKIRFLGGLTQLKKLTKLSLNNNAIVKIPNVLVNATVSQLFLEGNPVVNTQSFTQNKSVAFPSLS